jgi:hypothetical protein
MQCLMSEDTEAVGPGQVRFHLDQELVKGIGRQSIGCVQSETPLNQPHVQPLSSYR